MPFILSKVGSKEKPLPIMQAKPDPGYQVGALTDISKTFKAHARATVVMAFGGTGKTLVALWAAERAHAKTVLVLLPSLTLMNFKLY